MGRLRFGIFMAPFHPAGENPTLALQRDLELVEHLDRLGYDEAWIGEHHSAGSEIIASPEIFIAAAAERTRHIRLGTGVVSLSYHNPLWVTERMVLLDHLTRGRVMLGVGPAPTIHVAVAILRDGREARAGAVPEPRGHSLVPVLEQVLGKLSEEVHVGSRKVDAPEPCVCPYRVETLS